MYLLHRVLARIVYNNNVNLLAQCLAHKHLIMIVICIIKWVLELLLLSAKFGKLGGFIPNHPGLWVVVPFYSPLLLVDLILMNRI